MNRIAVFTLALAVTSGCALWMGERYERLKSVPPMMAVVYLYAADEVSGYQNVYVDRDPHNPSTTHVLSLLPKSYFAYLMTAGPIRILVEQEDRVRCISMDPQPGQHYWVRISSAGEQPGVAVTEAQQAEQTMASHRRMQREAKRESTFSYAGDCDTWLVSLTAVSPSPRRGPPARPRSHRAPEGPADSRRVA